jgi:5-formyltetrahydrofolate cyclo-ligase
MLPIEIRSLTEEVERTRHQIRQPLPGNPVPPEMIDLVVVPGLGFDLSGNRLGRGRGFYDRFLSRDGLHAVSCALAFEDQVVEQLPATPGDVRVHMLVTEAQVRRFAVPALR